MFMHIFPRFSPTVDRIKVALVLSVLLTAVSCGDDDSPTAPPPPPNSSILGSWSATSVVVDGVDQVPNGLQLDLFFEAEPHYDIFATNDNLGVICEGGATTCQASGEFSLTANQITFDPGEPDELTLSYTVSGDQLTLNGTIDGSSIVGTFSRN